MLPKNIKLERYISPYSIRKPAIDSMYYHIFSDEETCSLAGLNIYESPEDLSRRYIIPSFSYRTKCFYFIVDENSKYSNNKEYIGFVQCYKNNYSDTYENSIVLGYALSKLYRGQGIMPDSLKFVIDDLFYSDGYDTILLGFRNHNDSSKRVAEKLGFSYVETIPELDQNNIVRPENYYKLCKKPL